MLEMVIEFLNQFESVAYNFDEDDKENGIFIFDISNEKEYDMVWNWLKEHCEHFEDEYGDYEWFFEGFSVSMDWGCLD